MLGKDPFQVPIGLILEFNLINLQPEGAIVAETSSSHVTKLTFFGLSKPARASIYTVVIY